MKKAIETRSYVLSRRHFLLADAATTPAIRVARADGATGDPWSQSELIEPAALSNGWTERSRASHHLCHLSRFSIGRSMYHTRNSRSCGNSGGHGKIALLCREPAERCGYRNLLRLLSDRQTSEYSTLVSCAPGTWVRACSGSQPADEPS